MTLTKLFPGALVALMLAACGGGAKNEAASADTTATVPADATAPAVVTDAQADTTATLTYVASFKVAKPEKIVLEQYASIPAEGTEAPQKTLEITDDAALAEIVALANKLPDSGQIMVKWAETVPVLRVKLVYATGSQYFSFFQQSVKTPATNFYAGKKHAEEKQLYDLLTAKLAH